RDCTVPGSPCPNASQQTAVLGVIDAGTNKLIEKVPQSSNSHSVAADSKRNLIFVPQVAPKAVVGAGGDTTNVGAGICGTNNGCVGVFQHKVKGKEDVARGEGGRGATRLDAPVRRKSKEAGDSSASKKSLAAQSRIGR